MIVHLKFVPGTEDVALLDVEEILGRKGKLKDDVIEVQVDKEEEVVALNIVGRAFTRVLILLKEFEIKCLDDIYKGMIDIPFEEYIDKDQAFAIRGEKTGREDFTSVDIGKPAGQAVIDRVKSKEGWRPEVDLDHPDVIFRVYVRGDICRVYLDTTGDVSLHRRMYRVFIHPAALNPNIAYAMVRWSDWDPSKEILLDPMCGGGTIPIEAALWALGIPPGIFRKQYQFRNLKMFKDIDIEEIARKYSKKVADLKEESIIAVDKSIKYLTGAEKNARAARVHKYIKFMRFEAEWLDIKLKENSIDLVITNPPYGIRERAKNLEKLYKDVMYALDFVCKDSSRMVVITPNVDILLEAAKKYGFELKWKKEVLHGDMIVPVLCLVRG